MEGVQRGCEVEGVDGARAAGLAWLAGPRAPPASPRPRPGFGSGMVREGVNGVATTQVRGGCGKGGGGEWEGEELPRSGLQGAEPACTASASAFEKRSGSGCMKGCALVYMNSICSGAHGRVHGGCVAGLAPPALHPPQPESG